MFERVLLGSERPGAVVRGLPWVERLAAPGRVHLLTVLGPIRGPVLPGFPALTTVERSQTHLHRAIELALRGPGHRLIELGFEVVVDTRFGDPARVILTTAAQTQAGAIILITDAGTWPRRIWRRTTAESVLERARVPVFVVTAGSERAA